jgi:hypothetical protein
VLCRHIEEEPSAFLRSWHRLAADAHRNERTDQLLVIGIDRFHLDRRRLQELEYSPDSWSRRPSRAHSSADASMIGR